MENETKKKVLEINKLKGKSLKTKKGNTKNPIEITR